VAGRLMGLAHTAVCVPDVDEAVRWYESVLGMRVLSPPYLMEGPQIEADMGELLPAPAAVKAAIVGFDPGDHVVEVIEYPNARPSVDRPARALTDVGYSHLGLVCDDIEATRTELEGQGVRFLTRGVATVAGLRTTWFEDPYGLVYILMEKGASARPYWRQY
jgi:catechol 2,3-dioxygenase-like lactoylglutathione lyase family enzyme